jgi:hypothetical protein
MAVQTETAGRPEAAGQNWYARTPEEVAAAVGVDPAVGLPAARAGDLLAKNGPNALPEEKAKPGWLRFLGEYRSYMQIILVVAAVVSLVIKEWSTGVLLVLLTVLNAVVGMRQEGKAESAMNALRSMMKATARVRRDGSELVIPAEQVVVGDVVLITAGDEVPADGRIVAASALQIDESARLAGTRSRASATAWTARFTGRQAPLTPSRARSCRTWSPVTPGWSKARSSAIRPRVPCWYSATRPGWTSTRPGTACPGWPPCRSIRPTS